MTSPIDIDPWRRRTFRFDAIAEWRSVCTSRHNVLLEGPQASTEAALNQLTLGPCERVVWKRPHAPFDLPTGKCGTLVVQDIDALDGEEQARLLAWLEDTSRRMPVVATTASPLFPLVARGLFNATLYYRLNVVLLRLGSMNQSGARRVGPAAP